MVPVTKLDDHGKRRYQCANESCDARAYTAHPPEKVHGFGDECRGGGLRLGDKLAWLLNRIGITKKRWANIWGKEAECSPCGQRQQAINAHPINHVRWLNDLTNPRLWARWLRPAFRSAAWVLRNLP